MGIAAKGPRTRRDAGELGRFGMGLKTASFSQALKLSVWTRGSDTQMHVRVWDLDHVVRVGEWQLLHEPDIAGQHVFDVEASDWKRLAQLYCGNDCPNSWTSWLVWTTRQLIDTSSRP